MTASKNNPPRDDRPPEVVIDGLLSDATSAKKRISDYDQSQIDTLVEEIGWAIYQDHHARTIARTTYEETGFGSIADKYKKLRYGSKCILADLLGKPWSNNYGRRNAGRERAQCDHHFGVTTLYVVSILHDRIHP
ncbi:hypothetical protein [Halocatena halophila]|uniref:hypothetical protein n=1 Tax=Halocatena halophila TaxID=2814576 RepID=UPI002ED589BD